MSAKIPDSIAEKLRTAQIRVSNTIKSPQIMAEVAKFGYTANKMQEGKGIVENAVIAVNNKVDKEGDAELATENERKCAIEGRGAYQDFAKILRAIYPLNAPELTKLGLVGKMPISTAEFVKSGILLFDNAKGDAAISAKVLEKGYTVEKITSEKAKIEAYRDADQMQRDANGDSITSTAEQKKALDEMDAWVSEFTKIAKVALKKNKKLLEKIGIFTGKHTAPKKDDEKTISAPENK